MPVVVRYGDLFSSRMSTLVNAVNCQGVMGKGLARQFAARYPGMYDEYRALCARQELRPGILHLYTGSQSWILNFPTKDHWRAPSRLSYIQEGLEYFLAHYTKWKITSIAFPQLGCGSGRLQWSQVEPLMRGYLDPLPIDVEIAVGAGSV